MCVCARVCRYMEREGLVSPEDAMQDDLEAEMAEQAVAEQQALDSERESAMTEFLLLQRFAEAHGLSPEQTEGACAASGSRVRHARGTPRYTPSLASDRRLQAFPRPLCECVDTLTLCPPFPRCSARSSVPHCKV
ncbi:hypothetical protein EON67_07100, partial [archaeon]